MSYTLVAAALSFVSLLCELILELFLVRWYQVSVGVSGYWYLQESVDIVSRGIGVSGYRWVSIRQFWYWWVFDISGYWNQRLLVLLVISITGYRYQWSLV